VEGDYWVSDRARQEQELNDRVRLFDKFMDLALDGVITVEQAITGYKEEITNTEPLARPDGRV
jgi:hypothetical protein